MLATWGTRAVARTSVIAFKPLYKVVIPISQFTFPRALATAATAAKKVTKTPTAATSKASKAKAPAKKASAITAVKPAAKKAVAKPAAAKKKTAKAAAKPLKRGRKPKEKTEEERNIEKVKGNVKELVAKALDPPAIHTVASSWLAFVSDKYAAAKTSGSAVFGLLKNENKAWAEEYKALTAAQKEALKSKATSTKEAKAQTLQQWINKHTPAQIHEANVARTRLRLLKRTIENPPRGLKSGPWYPIPDERYPKKPKTPNLFYAVERVRNAPQNERMGALAAAMKEYGSLPQSEQKKYRDLHAADLTRYYNELRTIGINPSS